MLGRRDGDVLRQIHRLFHGGSVGGLSEWQLLDRYASRGDESAFEALLARHGPMVLGVCRRVLDEPQAVEDAFQATFLVLVRKAGSLGANDSIGHWLYGVARRVALHARSDSARRRSREVALGGAERVDRGDEPGKGELAPILDEELDRLPWKYRAPVVLCYLEGLTHEEAARQLRWPIGSVKGRLSRAKLLLRGRLARRGLVPSAGLVVALPGRDVWAAVAVPESLRQATVQLAIRASAGRAAAGFASASVVRLMEGVLSAMFATKLKVAATILGTSGCLVFGAWALGEASGGKDAGPNRPQAERRRPENVPTSRSAPADPAARERALHDKLEKPLDLNLSGARLEEVLKAIKKQTQGPDDTGVPIYVEPEGLKEAGATIDSPITVDSRAVPLRTALDLALRPLKLAATIHDGLLVVTSRQEVALIELRALNERLRRMPPPMEGSTEPGGAGGMSPAAWLKRLSPTDPGALGHGASPDEEAKTRSILSKLEEPVAMSFANETPLEDVLKYIKSATQGPKDTGIPIYIDPVGLNEAEKTMTSPVTLDLEGVPLKTTLRLLLEQLGLMYYVKDGLLTITSSSSNQSPMTPILSLADKASRGELSVSEMNDLIEMFKARAEVARYAEGAGLAAEGPAGGSPGPTPAATRPAMAEEDAKTALILAALEKVIPALNFKETPIDDAIQVIQKATVGPGLPEGVPIYLNPNALARISMGQKPWPPVTLNLKDVKLKTSLRLMLGQVDLTYAVKEGLLIVDVPDSPEIDPSRKGMAGGMGGMGGGFR